MEKSYHIGIPVDFNGVQPNHFGAPMALSEPLKANGFVGSTRLGGSCNVAAITMVPHCNGTHTECVGHISSHEEAIHECLKDTLVPATLISIKPVQGKDTDETYAPNKEDSDLLITKASLEHALNESSNPFSEAVIIRTIPNPISKKGVSYGAHSQVPFLSFDAVKFLKRLKIKHLLVDFPSIDKMYDEGKLNNHHFFWGRGAHKAEQHENDQYKTITEMIYVDNEISDGYYLLNLQIPSFMADAAPSRPILYPLEEGS